MTRGLRVAGLERQVRRGWPRVRRLPDGRPDDGPWPAQMAAIRSGSGGPCSRAKWAACAAKNSSIPPGTTPRPGAPGWRRHWLGVGMAGQPGENRPGPGRAAPRPTRPAGAVDHVKALVGLSMDVRDTRPGSMAVPLVTEGEQAAGASRSGLDRRDGAQGGCGLARCQHYGAACWFTAISLQASSTRARIPGAARPGWADARAVSGGLCAGPAPAGMRPRSPRRPGTRRRRTRRRTGPRAGRPALRARPPRPAPPRR